MFCAKCGTQNSDESKFCKKCGHSLLSGKNQRKAEGQTVKKGLFLFFITIILVAAVLLVIYLLRGRDEEPVNKKQTKTQDTVAQSEEKYVEPTKTDQKEENIVDSDEEATLEILEEVVEEKAQVKRTEETCYFSYHYQGEYRYSGYAVRDYDKGGNVTKWSNDYIERNYTYEFYKNGNVLKQCVYDEYGELAFETYYDEYGHETQMGAPESYDSEYEGTFNFNACDDNGNIIQKMTYWYIASDSNNLYYDSTTVYTYDENGLLETEVIYYDGSLETPAFSYRYEYDLWSNEKRTYSGTSIGEETLRVCTKYNAYGDVVSECYYDDEGNEGELYQYTYEYVTDDNGNVVEKNVYVEDELFITIKTEYY